MIPFVDLKAQYDSIKDEILSAVEETLDSTQFVLGRQVSAFEEEFAEFCGTRHAVAVNSGTSALHLALLAAGIRPGEEVITVSCTFVATVAAVQYAGAKAVAIDVQESTLTMDPSLIEAAITPSTRALLPVHLHGHPADMEPILEIAAKHDLVVIEDAAQAHGARYKGRRVGGLGQMGCFSFYPGKNLGAYGEGGAVTTNDTELDRRLRILRDWGQDKKYHHAVKGFNYRMDGVQGAILRVKLRHLESWNLARQANAELYKDKLAQSDLTLPQIAADCSHVYHVFAVRSPDRDELQERLADNDIQSGIHYPIPVHLQQAYADLGLGQGSLPVTERASRQLLSLPMFPELDEERIERVCSVLTHELQRV